MNIETKLTINWLIDDNWFGDELREDIYWMEDSVKAMDHIQNRIEEYCTEEVGCSLAADFLDCCLERIDYKDVLQALIRRE